MSGLLLLAALASTAPGSCGTAAPADTLPADSLEALYARGRSFAEFLEAARARQDTWRNNYAWGKIDPELLNRARALPEGWRLLVVADDSCGDSANTIPWVATLVDSLAGRIDMRVLTSREAQLIKDTHRTHDGRAATPTVVLLDPEGREAGCWVERPGALAAWARGEGSGLSQREFLDRKYAWYDADRGRETLRDMLRMIEQAGPGRACLGNT